MKLRVLAGICAALLALPACAGNEDLVAAARQQIGVTTLYDPAYRKLAYPKGDVPADRGVCTDVLVRALRVARSLDLQAVVHEDMQAHWALYPKRWGNRKPDTNIDHRRVPNLMTWFERQGWKRAVSELAASYLPGDFVVWDLGGGLLHVGIVSDRKSLFRTPLVVHNIGRGASEDDILFKYRVIALYRME
jgi:uncharacterized protein